MSLDSLYLSIRFSISAFVSAIINQMKYHAIKYIPFGITRNAKRQVHTHKHTYIHTRFSIWKSLENSVSRNNKIYVTYHTTHQTFTRKPTHTHSHTQRHTHTDRHEQSIGIDGNSKNDYGNDDFVDYSHTSMAIPIPIPMPI